MPLLLLASRGNFGFFIRTGFTYWGNGYSYMPALDWAATALILLLRLLLLSFVVDL